MLTLTDLAEKLKQVDEISLMEVLEINSEDLVNRFMDKIEEKMDNLITEFDNDSQAYDEGNEWWEYESK